MQRRHFVALVSLGIVCSRGAHAQQAGKVFRIGFLGLDLAPIATSLAGATNTSEEFHAFVAELRQLGLSVGENLVIEHRAVEDPRGPAAMAAELAQANVDLFVAYGPEAGLKALTSLALATPIVVIAVNYDPVERGYANSFARPAGNVTGVTARLPELAEKQLELLIQASPERTRVGVLWDANTAAQFGTSETAAQSLRIDLLPLKLENPPYDFAAAFARLAEAGAQSVLVLSSPFFREARSTIGEVAVRHRMPTMFGFPTYVHDGGLMSYGPSTMAMHRRAAIYVARIMNGTKPAELPIERSSGYTLTVNLKTAKALGLTIPGSLLARADEVME